MITKQVKFQLPPALDIAIEIAVAHGEAPNKSALAIKIFSAYFKLSPDAFEQPEKIATP